MPKTKEVCELEKKAVEIRIKSLVALKKAGLAGMGADMSAVEMLVLLYYGALNRVPIVSVDARKPGSTFQDYVIVSKKHATIVQYAILADLGFFSESELDFIANPGSLLQSRPNLKIPGITFTALTSGHGLSFGVGLALGIKMDRVSNKVFVVADISELQDGQFWEAVLFATHHNLNNLILLIDDCGFQNDGTVRSIVDIASVQNKFDSFGWGVSQVMNGHDFDQLLDSVSRAFNVLRKPFCIWCHTVSGKGIAFAERKHGYFNAHISEPELDIIIPRLKESL